MILTAATTVPLLTSCFVKEDRTPCPCWLEVDLSNVPEKSVVLSGWKDELLFRGPVSPSDYPDFYEVTVPRGEVYVTALGKNNDILNPTNLLVPEGGQADSLYAHCARLNTNCETVTDVVTLHKQFATVHLTMQIPEGQKIYPYEVLITGNCAGWDLRDLSGAKGKFYHIPGLIGENEYEFRVPRQSDSSLKIELYDGGEKVDEVALGEFIQQAGFDWNAEDLADISMNIKFRESQVLVDISGWRDTIILDVKI